MFENRIKNVVHKHLIDPNDADDVDRVMMCSVPSKLATQYTRMKTYGNHFHVADQQSMTLNFFYNGVAVVFHMPYVGLEEVTLNYVGVLMDILKLNYWPLCVPVIFIRCEWMKQYHNQRNPTYVREEAGFMVVNFRHKVPNMLEPFVFSRQTTQIFWSKEVRKTEWKVVIVKEAIPKYINRAQQMPS